VFRNRLVPSGLGFRAAFWLPVVTLIAALSLSGCGGSSKTVSVDVTASATSVDGTDQVNVTATVTNDSNSGGVKWTVSGGGTLSNTTATAATYTAPASPASALTVTVTATSVADTTKTASITLTVAPAPAISTSALSGGSVGTSFSVTLSVSGGVAPYTWSLISGTLPAGLTLNPSTGAITGTPTAAGGGTVSLTFKVTDSGTPNALAATEVLSLSITAAPAITFNAMVPPTATYNSAFTGSAAATGGAGTLTYSVVSGSLPTGLSLNTSTGAITGTATAAGPFNFTIKAADAFGDSNTQAYTITVSYPVLSVTTASLPSGLYNTTYAPVTLAASGGSGNGANLSWAWAAAPGSSLPAGLSLSGVGVISGKPTTTGAFSVVITVADSVAKTSAQATLSLTVTYPTLSVTTASLPNGVLNAVYTSTTLAAAGGSGSTANYTWSWAAAAGSSLPAGLNISGTGLISGTPTAGGTFSVVVTVADSVAKTSAQATLSITVTYPSLSITTASLPNGVLNALYSPLTLAATGGSDNTGNYSWSWAAAAGSSLPAGVSVSTAGVLSGTPTAGGSFSVVITVADSVSKTNATATLPITITYPALAITTSSLPNGILNAVYSPVTLAASGGSDSGANYTWTWAAAGGSSLPPGMALSAAGVLAGTPTSGGSYSVVITVSDSVSKSTASVTLPFNVGFTTLVITTTTLPAGLYNTTYTPVTLAATGGSGNSTNYTWTWAAASGSSLPAGLSLSTGGVISGKTTATGTYSVVVTLADSVSKTNTQTTLSLTVSYPTLTITTASLPNGVFNTTYAPVTLAATGGSGSGANLSWTWAAASGSSLPAGLSLSTAGVLSGKPTAAGSFSVVITVADSVSSSSAHATLSITVSYPTLTITTALLSNGVLNAVYTPLTLAATGGSGSTANYSWTWAAASGSSLPAGLNVSTAGVLSGTPTAGGAFSVIITVADSVSKTNASVTLPITIAYPTLKVTTGSLPNGVLSATYAPVTLAASGGSDNTANYSWTWAAASGSSLPAGLSLSTAGVISGKPTAGGSLSVVITVADSVSKTNASATLPITITYPALAVTTSSLPNGVLNATYSPFTLVAIGGSGNTANYTWSWTAASGSSLPAGLSLSTAGVLSGKPTAGGSFSVVITVADSVSGTNAQATLPITIAYPTLSVTTASLPSGVLNTTYTPVTLTATGGSDNSANYSWSWAAASGSSLPAGMIVSTAGALSGKPTSSGTFSVVLTVADSVSGTNAQATLSLVINTSLTITTITLPNGFTGTAYSQQLAAAGGSGGNTWSVTLGNSSLTAVGLSLSGAGLLSGAAPIAGSAGFTVQVKDSSGDTATQPFTVNVYSPLSLSPSSLPGGMVGLAYSASISAAGGSGNYCYTVPTAITKASGALDGLSLPLPNSTSCGSLTAPSGYSFYVGSSLPISGAPTNPPAPPYNISLNTTVIDLTTGFSITRGYSIAVTAPAALSLPTPNPSSLPSAIVNVGYSGSIAAIGGAGTYTWTVNGGVLSSGSASLGNGTLAATANGNSLTISGTPGAATTTGSPVSFTASVADNAGQSTGTDTYTIAVNNAGAQVSGQISFNNCGNVTMPSMTVSINTTPVQTTTTDGNGNFSFASVPNGTYTITPSITGPESVFYPATLGVTVSGSPVYGENFSVALGYTVSGTVTYTGSKTGHIYLGLIPVNCGGGGTQGTSISAAGAFTIRGVPPGSYNLGALMDNLGNANANATNPSGATNGLTISTQNLTGISIALADPASVTISSAPKLSGVSAFNTGALAQYNPITNSNGTETATSYTLQWSTSSTFTTIAGNKTFVANGVHTNVWLLNGLINGSIYYFRAYGTSTGTAVGPYSSTVGPITIGAPTGGVAVSGTVTFTGAATGPLYTGFYDQNTGNFYGDYIANPVSPQAYTVKVPTGSNYMFVGIIDQNKDGLIDAGDIQNTNNNNNSPATVITGATSGLDLTLPSANSTATVTTQDTKSTGPGGTSQFYNLYFQVSEGNELPVAVTLEASANVDGANVAAPMDVASCGASFGGCGQGFQMNINLYTVAPKAGDVYTFDLTYSDGTTQTVTATVSAVLKAFATALLPDSTGVSTTPTFTWTDPANPGNYIYQFQLQGNNGNIWQIPGNNSNLNGFPSSIASITWGVDPTGGGSTPSQSPLTGGTAYNWQIIVEDSNGNQATTGVQFTTSGTAPFTLPTPDPSSLGSAVVGQTYSGAINVSGGTPNYAWTVNGAAVPTNGSLLSIGDGLSVFNTGGNTLSVTGAPTSPQTVSFTASVVDISNTTDTNGTVTYTIDVSGASALSLPSPSTNTGSALIGYPYGNSLNASGGSGSGYVFTVNSTSVPTNGSTVSIGNGLSVSSTGGTTLTVSGTPGAATAVTLAVSVVDSASDSAGPDTYTINVSNLPSGTNSSNLNGRYVCESGGFTDSDGTLWASLSSFQANGSGSFTTGVFDTNGADFGAAVTGTVTGIYSIGADNNGIATLTSVPTTGSPVISKWAVALTNAVEPAQEFRMVEIDDLGATPSGRNGQADCFLATTSAFASGTVSGHNFVYLANGETNSLAPRSSLARFTALTGNVTGGVIDQAIGIPATVNNVTLTGGSYTLPTSPSFTTNGRYTLALTSGAGTANFAVYVIDSARMFILQTDSASGSFVGNIRTQQQASYSAANLNSNMVMYFQGLDVSDGAFSGYDSSVFQATGNGAGSFTINESYQDDSGTYTVGGANGTYPVTFDTTNPGRATFVPGSGTGYLYMYSNNAAGILVVDGKGELYGGFVDPQTQTTFTDAALAGTYMLGQFQPLKPKDVGVGEVDLASGGDISGAVSTGGESSFTWDGPQTGLTYSWLSNTHGSVSVADNGNSNESCAVISSTKFVCIQNTKSTPIVQIFQQ